MFAKFALAVCVFAMSIAALSASGNNSENDKNQSPSTPQATVPDSTTNTDAEMGLPSQWVGVWTGTCKSSAPGGRSNEFAMELRIKPTGEPKQMTWTIVYGEKPRQQVRDYLINTIDASKGHYRIDERNSIEIDSYLFGNTLLSQFIVQDTELFTKYSVEGDTITFELVSAQPAKAQKSGGKDGMPVVETYPINAYQRAELKRSK